MNRTTKILLIIIVIIFFIILYNYFNNSLIEGNSLNIPKEELYGSVPGGGGIYYEDIEDIKINKTARDKITYVANFSSKECEIADNGILDINALFPNVKHFWGALYYCDNITEVILKDLNQLKTLGSSKERAMQNGNNNLKVTLSGRFENLTTINPSFFRWMKNKDSSIEIDGDNMPNLTTIGKKAFAYYEGKLVFKGKFDNITTIGDRTFASAGNADSVIEISPGSMPNLTTIGEEAFDNFRGKITLDDNEGNGFDKLTTIGERAFTSCQHNSSKISFTKTLNISEIKRGTFSRWGESCCGDDRKHAGGTLIITCAFPNLTTIGAEAFFDLQVSEEGQKNGFDTNDKSIIKFVSTTCPKLKTIGITREKDYYGPFAMCLKRIVIDGRKPFSNLTYMEPRTFGMSENFDSDINFSGGLPKLIKFPRNCFQNYTGKLIIGGPFNELTTIEEGLVNGRYGRLTSPRPQRDIDNDKYRQITITSDTAPKLQVIGGSVADMFGGTLTISGSFKELTTIGAYAFADITGVKSLIKFTELPELKTIGRYSMGMTSATVVFEGTFPKLERIEPYAFWVLGASSICFKKKCGVSSIKVNGGDNNTSLKYIGEEAFGSVNVPIQFTGTFNALETIGESAFGYVQHQGSKLAISFPANTELGEDWDKNFSGTVIGCGEEDACNYSINIHKKDPDKCVYADQYYNCDGSCINDTDGDGVCNEFDNEDTLDNEVSLDNFAPWHPYTSRNSLQKAIKTKCKKKYKGTKKKKLKCTKCNKKCNNKYKKCKKKEKKKKKKGNYTVCNQKSMKCGVACNRKYKLNLLTAD